MKRFVCVTDLDHHYLVSWTAVLEVAYFTDDKFICHISFFVYTFFRLLDFIQKLNMMFLDFHNIQYNKSIIIQGWLNLEIIKEFWVP